MRIFEEISDNRRIKTYGEIAHKLNTSSGLLTGRRAENGIKIEKLLEESHGDFQKYQNIIREKLSEDYQLDFLDFSLLMGCFFDVYNIYCFIFVSENIRKRIACNKNINLSNTLSLFEFNYSNIYCFFSSKYNISQDDFNKLVSNLFIVRDDFSLYNNDIIKDIGMMLIGNYLCLEDYELNHGFIGVQQGIDYFMEKNSKLNNKLL